MLYLRTFGGLTLHNGAHLWPVSGGHRARHALLAILATAGERGVSRDRLFALFWPESDADRARGALKQALYTLRKELGESQLTLGNGVVRLNPDVIGSDVSDFDRAHRARDHSRAVELYAGPFLDGFHLSGLPEFDNWLERERDRLATQYCGALRELAMVAESAGDDAAAIAWWKRLSAADPLNAQPALSLIKALARTGDRVSALQVARSYQALVKAQLEVDADPAIESLAERIRSGAAVNDLAGAVANGGRSGNGGVRVPVPPALHNDPAEPGPATASPTDPLRKPDREWAIVAGAIMRRPWVWASASGILLAGTVIGAMAVDRESPVRTPLRFSVDLRAGERVAAVPSPLALSPDGTLLALTAARDSGPSRIVVRAIGDMQVRELSGTDDASQLFFSPDGRWIGYYERGLLKKVPSGGGTPVLIGRVPSMFGAAWSRDGDIVVSTAGALAVIPAAGGTPRRISTPDTTAGEFSQRWPIVLNDGTIVYTARGRLLEGSRIAVISKPGARQEILDLPGTAPLAIVNGHLLFSTARNLITPQNEIVAIRWDARRRRADGVPLTIVEQIGLDVQGAASASISASGSLAYHFDPEHRYQLLLANDRGEQKLALPDSEPFAFPRFSPDGRRIAVNLVSQGNRVKVFDRESGTLTLLTSEQAGYPEWTPDGKRIVFLRPGDNKGLWSKPADLSGSEQLLARLDSLDIMEGTFSRDGRRLVVRGYRMRDSTDEFWYRHLDGDTAWRPILTGGRRTVAPRLSPDGQWVAFSNSESRNHVYVTPVDGGPRFQVSLDRGWSPVWAPDGRRLFYFRGQQLIAATLRFTPSFAVVRRHVVLEGPYAAHGFHAPFDVSPDGREFALLRNVSPASRLVFVHDWKDELRQRTASAGGRR